MAIQQRIVLADPSPVYRQGLRSLITGAGCDALFEETNRFAGVASALADPHALALVVLDSRLSGFDSGEHLKRLILRHNLPFLVTTDDEDATLAATLLASGVSGVVSKKESNDLLEQALLTLIEGGIWLPRWRNREPSSRLPGALGRLSKQERVVLTLLRQGLKNRQIGEQMGISLSTVKRHVTHIYRKLGVDNKTRLVLALSDPWQRPESRSAA